MTTEFDDRGKESAQAAAAGKAEAALSRLPPRLRHVLARLLSSWPGRILVGGAQACLRIDIFDRAMTIAAQFFTAVFPILILFATWIEASNTRRIADAVSMPAESKSMLDDAVHGSGTAAFGVVGTFIVLLSATSLSRALSRAFADVWQLPRPKAGVRSAWRWLAAVLVLAMAMVVVRALSESASAIPPDGLWQAAVSLAVDVAVAAFVPWVLLSGRVQFRLLVPGALVFAVLMTVVRPASAIWLPNALDTSAERYGSIGVAFTYLAWLYVASFCFLATAAIGRVVATDGGPLGARIRGESQGDMPRQP